MKTFFILLTAVLLQASVPVRAAGPHHQTSTCYAVDAKGVHAQLNRLLAFTSDQITGLEGKVNFIVRLRQNGRLEVLDIYGDTVEVVGRVRRVLERSRLQFAPDLEGRAFRVGIDYGLVG